MNWVDTISLMAWVVGAAIGLFFGFIRIWVPFAFLIAGVGFAGALAFAFGPSLSGVLETKGAQLTAAFFAVFAITQLLGAFMAYTTRHLMSIASALVSVFPMGALLNRGGGFVAGTVYGCIFVSVIFIGLYQWPVETVTRGVQESSFAQRPIGWVDRYVASIEISSDWDDFD